MFLVVKPDENFADKKNRRTVINMYDGFIYLLNFQIGTGVTVI